MAQQSSRTDALAILCCMFVAGVVVAVLLLWSLLDEYYTLLLNTIFSVTHICICA